SPAAPRRQRRAAPSTTPQHLRSQAWVAAYGATPCHQHQPAQRQSWCRRRRRRGPGASCGRGTTFRGSARSEGEHRRGEAMHLVASGYRSDLTRGKEARYRIHSELIADSDDVVVGVGEHLRTTTIAGEQQHAFDGVERRAAAEPSKPLSQILVRRTCIADLELHGPADRDEIADDKPTAVLVDAPDPADEEVADPVLFGVLVHCHA